MNMPQRPLYRIRFGKWMDALEVLPLGGRAASFRLYADGSTEALSVFVFIVSNSRINSIASEYNKTDEALERAVLNISVRKIEQWVTDGTAFVETNKYHFVDEDYDAVVSKMKEKRCDYQIIKNRDLFCSANRGEPTFVPVSIPLCKACGLPDADAVCSQLTHPHSGISHNQRGASFNLQVLCNAGKLAFLNAQQCRPGGNDCWERFVEQQQMPLLLVPQALPEAIDFLDATWRLAFGKRRRLLALKSAVSTASLLHNCRTRQDFSTCISALDDIFKTMIVDDDLLPEKDREKPEIKGDKTLNRIRCCLETKLVNRDERESALRGVKTLKQINEVRQALQHGGKSTELGRNLAELGIPFPPEWGDAWDRVRAKAVEALQEIRNSMRSLTEA